MNLKQYNTILWDWNGTLVDDAWLSLAINNELLAERGLPPVSLKYYKQVFGFPIIDYYKKIGFNLETEPFEVIAQEFITRYEDRRFECTLQEGASRVLNDFSSMGMCQNILSATHIESLKPFVEHYELTPYFTNLLGLDNHYAASKVQIGLDWLKKAACDPNQILIIGDTLHDYEVARALGADCIIIANGHQDEARLRASGAKVLKSLKNLADQLAQAKKAV